jgi:beta-galactosidase
MLNEKLLIRPANFTIIILLMMSLLIQCNQKPVSIRSTDNFGKQWMFQLGEAEDAKNTGYNDSAWRRLSVPHDWSIEGEFSKDNPATPGGGALPGGIGWYRKTFTLPESDNDKSIFIDFDGVYMNSDVWINGHHLGHRPYGYISFRYELTPHLKYGKAKNVLAVRVDNSLQPNSRWYSGCGIYRNVWLVKTDPVHVDQWGTYITTPEVTPERAIVSVQTTVKNSSAKENTIALKTILYDKNGKKVSELYSDQTANDKNTYIFKQKIEVKKPDLWSVESPALYSAVSQVLVGGKVVDDYKTTFGIRTFKFDVKKDLFSMVTH